MTLEGARERRVRTGGVELCVAELGDASNPTVVLVHGYPDSKEVWSEVASRLADRFHVVLYDVRGHGRSTAPQPLRGGFTLEKLTDDFLAVADAVSPDRPVHLVGHDWGSVQSWEFVTVERTRGRIASFTSMSGPSLDHFGHWINKRLTRPTPRRVGQLLSQGAKSWYVYLLHTPVLPELAWRGPWAPAGRRSWSASRRSRAATTRPPRSARTRPTAPGCTATTSARGSAGPARTRTRTRPCSSSRPWGRVPVGAALRRTGAVGPGVVRHTLPAKHWVPGRVPTNWRPGSRSS